MAVRWGICSAGLISSDFCSALKSLPYSEHEIVAVAARKQESADAFAEKFGIAIAYSSYESLAKDPNIEIVYVGTISSAHYAACMLFLECGKHVLCEKPLTLTLQESKELVTKAKEKNLFFMEAFWTRFFPAVHAMQEVLRSGTLGRINFLRVQFCISAPDVPRLVQKELGGGGLMDIGCYPVQYANMIFKEQPEKTVAMGNLNEEGVDTGGALLLHYKGGAMALLCYSVDGCPDSNILTINGSNGNLMLHSPMHCPTKITLPSGEMKEFPLPESSLTYNFTNSVGMLYEAQAVRECLRNGKKECPEMTLDDTLNIMAILEQAQKQMGIHYKEP